jgi:hypothetical protein
MGRISAVSGASVRISRRRIEREEKHARCDGSRHGCSADFNFACGKERWPVKVGADQDVGQITSAAAASTIALPTSIPAPPNPNVRQNTRFAPVETAPATLSVTKRETDQDYHLFGTSCSRASSAARQRRPSAPMNGAGIGDSCRRRGGQSRRRVWRPSGMDAPIQICRLSRKPARDKRCFDLLI